MNLRTLVFVIALGSVAGPVQAFKDIECKAKTTVMITEPGSFERVLTLVKQNKTAQAKKLVRCTRDKGRGIFIVGAGSRKRSDYVPVSTGDCVGETYRSHLVCPSDPPLGRRVKGVHSRTQRVPR